MNNEPGFATRAIHVGQEADPATGATVVPIYATSTFTQEEPGKHKGFEYSRTGNPTRAALEKCLASLEGGERCLGFASGSAATAAVLAQLRPGDEVAAAADLYGGTYRLLERVFKPWGLVPRYTDDPTPKSFAAILSAKTKLLWIETPTNPLLQIVDIAAIAEVAHKAGALLAVDNTFASPYLFTPIASGADFVIHSATKYIGGHGDVMAGVVASTKANRQAMFELNKLVGSVLGPFDAWLSLRGLKTLPLRMQRQCQNAAGIADWLNQHPKISRVNYPGLPAHPQHALAGQLFGGKGYGGMVSFEIAGADKAKAFRFLESLQLCQPATTLGDIYTLLLHPATTSHRALTPAERARIGISDGLLRLSAGIEALEDLLADLDQALERQA
jgi:cystathionine gamma-lyase